MTSMSVESLLQQLAEQGIELWVEGSRLRFRAPKGRLAPQLRTELIASKDEVVAALRARMGDGARYSPLSFSQRALWFVNQEDPSSAAYNVGFAAEIHSPVNEAVLRHALQALIDRHAVLRTTYELVDGQPRQRVADARRAVLETHSVEGADEASLKRRVEADYRRPFDLERGPVLRASLFSRSTGYQVLLLTMPHIAIDGWSLLVLLEELGKLLIDEAGGAPAALPRPELEYTDYVAWQEQTLRSPEGERVGAYWATKLAEPRAQIELPCDRPRPARRSVRGATFDFRYDAALSAQLAALAKAEGTTLFVVMLAAFKCLLYRYTGTEDVVVGTPTLGRTDARFARLLGDFVNPLPLRSRLDGQMSFRELLASVKRTLAQMLEAQEFPMSLIVERQNRPRDPSRSALFETVFVLQKFEALRALNQLLIATPGSPLVDFGGLKVRPFAIDQQEGQFDLGLGLIEAGDALSGTFKYNREIFDEATVRELSDHYRALLASIVANPAAKLGELSLLDAQERAALIRAAGEPAKLGSRNEITLHGRFEQQVRRTPQARAVTFEGQSLTYAQLNARANRLAHQLLQLGIEPQTPVALYAERSLDLVVGLLAILKAGAGYVPIDLSYPADRVGFMLEDTRAPVLVTQRSLVERIPRFSGTTVCIDAQLASLPEHDPPARVGADGLAYIIYTSGSTGRPKGTMLTHRAVDRLFTETDAWYRFNERDVWTMFHSVAFDFSVWEIWGALLYGGRLVVVPYLVSRAPDAFLNLLHDEGVTVLNQTPSAFRQLVQADLAAGAPRPTRLRTVIFGGEALELQSLRPWFERYGDVSPTLVNMYGITETCVHVTYRPIRIPDLVANAGSVIGEPIPDLRVHVLDARREPTPYGVAGEMYVGGPGLARGYLNRPELTSERFVADPFVPGDRLYRTGDLAKRLRTGELEYLGRIDHQVKIRGFRIELGEIEAVIAQGADIRQSVVLAVADDTGNKRLVAYVVATAEPQVALAGMRARLSANLPDYMMPSAFMFMEALPLTSNGKVDRAALPKPDAGSAAQAGEHVPLETETEQAIGAIWCELLGLARVGRYDNFFQLGGHSLLVVALLDRMRRVGLMADVRSVFSLPTLAEIAAAVDAAAAGKKKPEPETVLGIPEGSTRIVPSMLPLVTLDENTLDFVVSDVPGGAANVQDIYPLMPCQEGMLFHHVLQGDNGADTYQTRSVLEFVSRERLEQFMEALHVIVGRHDSLRTAVLWEDVPQPIQVVYRNVPLRLHEVSNAQPSSDPTRLLEATNAGHVRLDLRKAPLIAAYASAASGHTWHLALVLHHIVIDFFSVGVLLSEVRSLLAGAALPPPPPMRNFVAAALAVPAASHEAHFRLTLADVREPTLPFGLTDVRVTSSDIHESSSALPVPLASDIRQTASRLGVSPAALFHIGWALVVAQASKRDDVVFGTVLSGRAGGSVGADRVVGMFINTLPCRVTFQSGSLAELVKSTHAQLAALSQHDQASLALAQKCSAVASSTPLFSALFNFRHGHAPRGDGTNDDLQLDGVRLLLGDDRTNYPLTLAVDDSRDAFEVSVQCVRRIDAASVAKQVESALTGLVAALADPTAQAAGLLTQLARLAASVDDAASDLLNTLQSRDVRLTLDAGRLKVNAPKGALDDALKAAIGTQREALIRVLSARAAAASVPAHSGLAVAAGFTTRLTHAGERAVSLQQHRLWLLRQIDPQSAAYNLPFFVRLRGVLDVDALERSLARAVERQESLRTRFVSVEGAPRCVVELQARVSLTVSDLSAVSAGKRESEVSRCMLEAALRPIDLGRCPLMQVTLVRLSAREQVLCIVLDRIIADAGSLEILFAELGQHYAREAGGAAAPLPPLHAQYLDFANAQREALAVGAFEPDLSYWKQQLASLAPMLTFPADRPRPPVQTFNGARLELRLPQSVSEALESACTRQGTTLPVMLMTALQALLHRYTGEVDIAVGQQIANRSAEFSGVVGPFADSLVLRGDFDGSPSIAEAIGRMQPAARNAHTHASLPFDRLVDALMPRRSLDHSALFQVAFELRDRSPAASGWASLDVERVQPARTAARVDVTLEASPLSHGLELALICNADLFDAVTMEALLGHYRSMLEAFAATASMRIADVPLLNQAQLRRLTEDWGQGAVFRTTGNTVHGLFEAQARRAPDALALRFESVSLSYRELDARASRLAHHLRGLGVVPDKLVGVWMERGVDMVVALLGILKAGGAYVPLDPAFPRDRIEFMIEDAALDVVVTQSALADSLPGAVARKVCVDADWPTISRSADTLVEGNSGPANLAYVLYTSGSTGKPKGVQVEHGSVASFLQSMHREPGIAPGDRFVSVTTLSFDIAGLEIHGPLTSGAAVVLASREIALDGVRLAQLLDASEATILQGTPATWRLLIEAGWRGRRGLRMLCGGEALPRDIAAKLLDLGGELWNMYGPTETTIWSTLSRVTDLSRPICIGRPIANTSVYVLEPSGLPAPIGVAGELCIGGAGGGRRFWNCAGAPAPKFALIGVAGRAPERVYRTGDLARFRADGQLEFIGRRDHQVKVRGFRIELGEIEAVLAAQAGVQKCVVIVREDVPGEQRLVAYVVPPPGAAFDSEQAREGLRAKLPDYMAPRVFVQLDALPLTPNAKVDRRALPAPPAAPVAAASDAESARSPVERRVSAIWREVLRLDHVGLHDNFFDLGGHSLLLVRLQSLLKREFAVDLPLVELFQRTTVASQAQHFSAPAADDGALRRAQARAARQSRG